MLLPVFDAGDTVRFDPTMTAIAATKVAPAEIDSAPSGLRSSASDGGAAAVAVGIVILVLFLGLLLGGVFSGRLGQAARRLRHRPRARPPRARPPRARPPRARRPRRLRLPRSRRPLEVSVAALNAGVTNGTVAPAAGQQLNNQLQPLLFSEQPEPAAQQVQQFDQLVQSFDQDVANGQVTGTSTRLLRRAINRLAVALGTTVPTVTTTPAPAPPGQGATARERPWERRWKRARQGSLTRQ